MIAGKRLNLIALLRVSTDDQDVKRQRTDIEKLQAKVPEIHIIRIVELIGVSGTATLENADVLKILAELSQDGVDGIAISALDRLFRPAKRWAQWGILDYFCDANKSIWSLREGLIDPNTPEGRDKCLSAGGRAGAEWQVLKQRTNDGKMEKAREGFLPHGNARYGYNIISRKNTGRVGQGKAVINEIEAAVVRKVFDWAYGGMATNQMAARLNKEGILSKGSKGKPPAQWTATTILQMLGCEDYIGKHYWKDVMIPVPRIVTDEVFYGVQAKMAARKAQWQGRPSELYLFRSFLYCGRCKHRCTGSGNKGPKRRLILYYRCGRRKISPPRTRLCDAPVVRAVALEEAGWSAIWAMLKNPKLLLHMGKAIYADQTKPDEQKVARIEKEIAKLKKRDNNLKQMQEDAGTPEEFGECRAKRTAIRGELAGLEVELQSARKVVTMPTLSALEQYIQTITTGAEPKTYDERRPILEALVDLKIEHADRKLLITGSVPVPSLAAFSGDGENSYSGVRANSSSPLYIPFILNARVA